MERKQSFITEVVHKIKLAKQEDVSIKKLEHIYCFFSVVSALYLLLSVLSSPALSLRYRAEVTAISCLLAAFNSH